MDFAVPLLLAAIGTLSVLGWWLRGPLQPLIPLAMILGLSGAAALLFSQTTRRRTPTASCRPESPGSGVSSAQQSSPPWPPAGQRASR